MLPGRRRLSRRKLIEQIQALEREMAERQQYVVLMVAALCAREDNNTIEIADAELVRVSGVVHWWDDRARDVRIITLKEEVSDGDDEGSEPRPADGEPESGDPAAAGTGGERED